MRLSAYRLCVAVFFSFIFVATQAIPPASHVYAQAKQDMQPRATSLGSSAAVPAVGRNADGRLEVFALGCCDSGGNPAIFHDYQVPNGGGTWSGWKVLPPANPAAHILWVWNPAVGQNADGRLELFAISFSGNAYHDWQTAPNGGWSGWQPMPSGGLDIPAGVPAVGRNLDGRLEVFVAIKDHGYIQHIWQSAANSPFVANWATFPDQGFDSPGRLSVGQDHDGRLEVFGARIISDQTHQLFEYYQLHPNGAGSWSAVQSMGNVPGGISHYLSVAEAADGGSLVVTVDGQQAIYYDMQSCPGCAFLGLTSLGYPPLEVPVFPPSSQIRMDIWKYLRLVLMLPCIIAGKRIPAVLPGLA